MQLGRYLVGERLAVGGMGEVRLAMHTGLGGFARPIALKLLLPHLAEQSRAVEMFLNEARLASQMSHPNVVKISDVGSLDGHFFICMELVRGVSMAGLIKALVARGQQLPVPVLQYVGRALCDGLHHAHELSDARGVALNIVHRDVTPHNVLLSVEGEVKLTDFGIARARGAAGSAVSGVSGKLAYLPPEALAGGPVDRRVDVFGAAVTLYELASLRSPFQRDSEVATIEAIRAGEAEPLERLRPELPPRFVEAVRRGMASGAKERFPDARQFRNALAEAPPTDAAEALGELVGRLCPEMVTRLEDCTRATVALGKAQRTGSLSGQPQGPHIRHRRGWTRLVLGLLVLVPVLGAAGFALQRLTHPQVPEAHSVAAEQALPQQLPGEQLPASLPPEVPPEVPPEPAELAEAEQPVRRTGRAQVRALAKAPATVGEPGYLSIDAVPWAKVTVNGKAIGETPIHRFPVKAGWAALALSNPETGKRETRRVRVQAGKEHHLRVHLQ